MTDFNTGDKVTWVAEMVCVPHPEGKTDRNGVVLPVFRDKTMTGTIIHSCYDNRYTVRPDDTTCPKGMDSYYDKMVGAKKLSIIK
tara:strand:- start:250 stop:504 length:255 start_codon:yes stop_codon:yes gene_type:complete